MHYSGDIHPVRSPDSSLLRCDGIGGNRHGVRPAHERFLGLPPLRL